jgi:hypothetical protein
MTDPCTHGERVQVAITGLRSFPCSPEPDGVILITHQDLSNFAVVQVETICHSCGEQRVLDDNEWEIA